MYSLLIFDFSNIYNINYFKFSKDKDNDGSGGVYHSLLSIIDYLNRYKNPPNAETTSIVFALDKAWYPSDKDGRYYRRQIYPDYKANRPPKEEAFVKGIKTLNECIKYAFNNSYLIGIPGYEADDVVEPVIKHFESQKEADSKFLLISNDGDWFARVNHKVNQVQWYNITTENGFIDKNGYHPKGLMMEKMIRGDAADNIPKSVLRLPSPFVKHICQTYNDASEMYLHLKEDTVIDEKWKSRIIENKEAVYRNEKLVRPLEIPEGLFKRSIYKVKFDKTKLLEILMENGCETNIVERLSQLNL